MSSFAAYYQVLMKEPLGDVPGGPAVKASPSSAEGAGLITGLGVKISHALKPKNQTKNRSNTVTNSIKDFRK